MWLRLEVLVALKHVNSLFVDPNSHADCIELGLCMRWRDFLHIGLWGLMDNLVVMKPPPKVDAAWVERKCT